MNTNEILSAHGLDFNISKRALKDDNNNPSGYFGLYNDNLNKCIHAVKEGYQVSQNREIVDLVLKGVESFGGALTIQKGGAISDGRKIFLQLRIEGDTLIKGDRIKRYITIIDSNDGTTSLSVGIGDLTMSCQNQFYKFYKDSTSKFRHSSSLEQKIKEFPSLIERALIGSMAQSNLYRELSDIDISKDLAHEMVNYVLGYDRELTSMDILSEKSTRSINKMNALYNAIDIEIADKGFNLWGLHSGVTRFTTHDLSAPKRSNGREQSLMLGSGYSINDKSIKFVTRKSGILELV